MDSETDWLCEILQNVQLEQFYLAIRDQLQVNENHFILLFGVSSMQ